MTTPGGGAPSVARILRSRRVVTAEGVRPATVHLRDGLIDRVGSPDDVPDRASVHEAGSAVVMAGVVDTHVHVNEPGRTEWEGFATATRAAAAGGITTILDMPLNSIPATTSVEALAAKRRAATGACLVNVGFIGGVVPGNTNELAELRRGGVRAFKCFMVDSGIPEFAAVQDDDLRRAMGALAGLGVPLMVHAEIPERLAAPRGDPRTYGAYLATRPVAAELEAVARVVRMAGEFAVPLHVVHLSSAESLAPVLEARANGQTVTVETCPHYLTFASEEIPEGATEFKCAPPIREAAAREALRRAVIRGDIDMIVSDHSPCPPELKRGDTGDFFAAWGGIASLQLGLSAAWTCVRGAADDLLILADRMCAAPSRLAGLADRKGRIAAGYDADLVIWDPDASFVVQGSDLQHRHKLTPYAGRTLFGTVQETIVGGRTAYPYEPFSAPQGEML